jgi:hypothetical protein
MWYQSELLAPVLEGARVVLLQPLVPVEEVELLAPEHSRERLAHDVRLIR